jgi:hypothetical protein
MTKELVTPTKANKVRTLSPVDLNHSGKPSSAYKKENNYKIFASTSMKLILIWL